MDISDLDCRPSRPQARTANTRLIIPIPDENYELSDNETGLTPSPSQPYKSQSSILLPPPSPSPPALLLGSPPPNPFARPLQQLSIDRVDTPVSALPSRFLNNEFLPSPSSFYPDWNVSGGDRNTIPSPIDSSMPFATSEIDFLIDYEPFPNYALGYQGSIQPLDSPRVIPLPNPVSAPARLERHRFENHNGTYPKKVSKVSAPEKSFSISGDDTNANKAIPSSNTGLSDNGVQCNLCGYQPRGNPKYFKGSLAKHMKRHAKKNATSSVEKNLNKHNGNSRRRKTRRDYPSSWGFDKGQMTMKKRVLAVFDGPRRLAKDDLLDKQVQVRLSIDDMSTIDEEQLKFGPNPQQEPRGEVAEVKMPTEFASENEFTFTDSGYGSHLNQISLGKVSNDSDENLRAFPGAMDNFDACTLYSGGTTVATPTAQTYISEICNDIHKRLDKYVDINTWAKISNALPNLVKGFAVKLGNDSDAQVNRDIMYFVHKWHKDVVAQLRGIFSSDTEQCLPPQASRGMGLSEKMAIWQRKYTEDEEYALDANLFEGVDDKEDDPFENMSLSTYHKTIFSSPAYEWFISSCRKALLQWEDSCSYAMTDIRHKLVERLPTGTISKKYCPKPHRVTFVLKWDMSMTHRLGFNNDLSSQPCCSLPEFIAITGSQSEAHALTVTQYMEKMWPTNGQKMLDAIIYATVFFNLGGSMDMTALSHTSPPNQSLNESIVANLCGDTLSVTAEGPKYFIAECGEQLGWILSALQSKGPDINRFYEPSITHIDILESPSPNLGYSGQCDIGLRVCYENDSTRTQLKMKSCWQAAVGGHNLIQGYPISQRPAGCAGLELSFGLLLHFMQAKEAFLSGEHIFIEGSKTAKLVIMVQDVCVWHLCAERQKCCCYENAPEARISDLGSRRHILGNCQSQDRPKKDDSKYKRAGAFQERELGGTSASEASSPDITRLHLKVSKPSSHRIEPFTHTIKDKLAQSRSGDTIQDKSSEGSLLSEMLSEPSFRFQSTTETETDDFSLDTDDSSISNAEYANPLHPNEPLYPILSRVLHQLLSGFRSQTQRPSGSSSQGTGSQNPPVPSNGNTNASGMQNSRKRKRGTNDKDNTGEDGAGCPPDKKSKCEDKSKKSFACPYLKRDPLKHRDTCARQLSRIRDVKQHLHRRHAPERYCQRCLVTHFDTEESLQEHIRLGACCLQDSTMLDGISHDQRRRLGKKSDSKLSEEDQWFVIWEIIFPNHPKPPSAYIEAGLSTEMRIFSEYSYVHGPGLLSQQILFNSSWTGEDMSLEERQEALGRIIADGLRQIVASWRWDSTNPHSAPQTANTHQTQQTPLSHSTDSGIMMEGQTLPAGLQTNSVQSWSIPEDAMIGGQPSSSMEPTVPQVYEGEWRTLLEDGSLDFLEPGA